MSRRASRSAVPSSGGNDAAFRSGQWLAAGLIACAALVAYHNSFGIPFLFDDDSSIKDNPTIRSLWRAWWPPTGHGLTVSGRPLLNFTFALNWLAGGRAVWGYHALNLAIHAAAGLVLFGVVRRTLLQPVLAERFGRQARELALAAAVLWTVHPLQTESVTYIVQRAESLVGLCYLATLLCFIRATSPGAPARWRVFTWVCCLLGMATKEVMATAPVVLLFYDRIFVAGGWRAVWAARGRFHLALAGTWLLLGGLLLATGNRGGTAGLGTGSSLDYALTQVWAITHYLRLAFWPAPLVFDYGREFITDPVRVGPAFLVLLPLAIAGGLAAWRGRPAGFGAVFFCAVLAPSSSVVPVVTQTMAEHRMYLPLAVLMVMAVALAHRWLGRPAIWLFAGWAVVLTATTVRRNEDYRSELSIWGNTVAKQPQNARAHLNLGIALSLEPHRLEEALHHLRRAVELRPDDPDGYNNLGVALSMAGRLAEAVAAFERVLTLDPQDALARANLAALLNKLPGRRADALRHAELALRVDPEQVAAHALVGAMLAEDPARRGEAIRHLREAIRLDPEQADAHANLAVALATDPASRQEALAEAEEAVRLRPDSAGIQHHRAAVLENLPGRAEDAARAYATAQQLDPAYWPAHYDLGRLRLKQPEHRAEALAHLAEAARLAPDNYDVRTTFAQALADIPGRMEDASREFAAALKLRPEAADAHFNLGAALLRLPGREGEAREQFEAVLRLQPDDADAHVNLAALLAAVPGHGAAARAHLETALRLRPGDAEAHYQLARLLLPGEKSAAIRQLEAALELAPQHEPARQLLGELHPAVP